MARKALTVQGRLVSGVDAYLVLVLGDALRCVEGVPVGLEDLPCVALRLLARMGVYRV